jgi:hypothetical protein
VQNVENKNGGEMIEHDEEQEMCGGQAVEELDCGLSKSAESADLEDELKAIEQQYGADDPDFARPRAIAAVAHISSSYYRAGMELHAYHQTLHHGAWTPALREFSLEFSIGVRTLEEIVTRYLKVKDAPPEIVKALEKVGIDPAAPR